MATDTITRPLTGAEEVSKPIHTILLDTAPILLNTPSISTLLANCHLLVTTPGVIAEVRGEEARQRLETLYKPFLTTRSPKPESVRHVREFARKTGDAGVLSSTDYDVLALAYDLECERNHGDWRLRKVPGQKRLNGSPPAKTAEGVSQITIAGVVKDQLVVQNDQGKGKTLLESTEKTEQYRHGTPPIEPSEDPDSEVPVHGKVDGAQALVTYQEADSSSSDGEGWITPSNIKKKQVKDESQSNSTQMETKTLQVATMTGDFAMQNVLLQMNLNLLSTKTCKRVAHIKQMILRCHGCFATTRDMTKQFCVRCGKPTLTRVTCTTNDKGEVKLHLKSNHQWNNRGNVFSIPKPTSGTSNQKWQGPKQGGGQGGWGNGLILAEDQKEYVRAMSNQKRTKAKDLMDEDTLPSILTGDRGGGGDGKLRVGGGRNINARRRK